MMQHHHKKAGFMIVDIDMPPRVAHVRATEWSAAEFLDAPFSGDTKLRAMICRLGPGKWQWVIMSLDCRSGELIASGTETDISAARTRAASEIAKCLESPFAA